MAARAFVLRALAAILIAAFTLALVEGAASVALHYAEAEPEPPADLRGTVLLSGRSVRTVADPWLLYRVAPDQATEHVRINSLGLRNGPIDPEPSQATFRVLLLGGSVAFGYTALDNERTPAAELERWLAARAEATPALRGRRVEVLNAGVPGYVSRQSVLSYVLYHRRLRPAVVISLDGANDVSAAIRTGEAGAPMRWDVVRGAYLAPEPTLSGWLVHRARRLRIVELVRTLRPPALADFAPPPPAAVAAAYRAALELLADSARGEGALAMGVLQPVASLAGAKPLAPFEREVVAHYEAECPGSGAYYEASFGAMREIVAALEAERPGLVLLDATRVFAAQTGIAFTDPTHLSQPGVEQLAAAIGERLLERLRRPAP